MSKLTRLFAVSPRVFFIGVVVPACTGILLSAKIFAVITICEGFALASSCDSPSKCRWSRSKQPKFRVMQAFKAVLSFPSSWTRVGLFPP